MVENSETWHTFHSITKTQTIVAVRFTPAFLEEVSTNNATGDIWNSSQIYT